MRRFNIIYKWTGKLRTFDEIDECFRKLVVVGRLYQKPLQICLSENFLPVTCHVWHRGLGISVGLDDLRRKAARGKSVVVVPLPEWVVN